MLTSDTSSRRSYTSRRNPVDIAFDELRQMEVLGLESSDDGPKTVRCIYAADNMRIPVVQVLFSVSTEQKRMMTGLTSVYGAYEPTSNK